MESKGGVKGCDYHIPLYDAIPLAVQFPSDDIGFALTRRIFGIFEIGVHFCWICMSAEIS